MSQAIETSDAIALHRRDYGETSKIISFFTLDEGRVDVLCKGCRTAGKRARVLEPFRKYRISWSGKSELKTLRQYDELTLHQIMYQPERLYCGLYLNELMLALVRVAESDPELFYLLDATYARLASCDKNDISRVLRDFEFNLIECMGYAVSFLTEGDGETTVQPDLIYGFKEDYGFYATQSEHNGFHGDSLVAIASGEYTNTRQLKEAKQLARQLISYYLPNCSIQSRKLFS